MSVKVVERGFGSSGAGNRTGRRKFVHSGTAGTRRVEEYSDLRRSPPARLDDPVPEELQYAIRHQLCWWCGREGFKVLALHTQRAHGIDRFELRRLAGLFYTVGSICSPEHSEARKKRMRKSGWHPTPQVWALRKPRHLSEACKRLNMEKMARMHGLPDVAETRKRASKRAGEVSRSKAKGHPCPVCRRHVHLARRSTCGKPKCITERKRQNGLKLHGFLAKHRKEGQHDNLD